MERFLNFDQLVAPTIIKILYYLGIAFWGMAAVGIYSTAQQFVNDSTGLFLGVIVFFAVSVIFNRILCELILVVFMIREELAWQRQHLTDASK